MNDELDKILETLFSTARVAQPDTARVEFGFETRFAARLREETCGSLAAWAWKLCPFFAALAIAVGWWNYSSLRSDADAQIVVEAARANDDQTLLAYMTGGASMRTALRILGIILIFLFGVFIGVAGRSAAIAKRTREVMMGGPESIMAVVVKRLDSELNLDLEQKRKLQTIVDDAHIKLRQSQDKIQPEIEATLGEAEQRVREMLYRNQVEKFDELVNRSREKWKPKEKVREKEQPKETPKPEGAR